MFYKVTHNNMVVDLLTDVQYVRFLPRQKRLVKTDSQSANAVMGSDHNTVYHLCGKPYTFDDDRKSVQLVRISEEEYDRLSSEFAIARQENAQLRDEMASLKSQLGEQNDLLAKILEKLNG